MAFRIVVISEPSPDLESLRESLVAKGHSVAFVSASEADSYRRGPRDIVLAAGDDAVETCEAVLARDPKGAVVVLDGKPSMRRAIQALRAGALDFVTEPGDADAVDGAIRRVAEKRAIS